MKRTCVVGALEDTCCADYRDTFVAKKSVRKLVPRRGNNLAQTLACRACKQALPRQDRYSFRNFFRNPVSAGYQNPQN